MEEYTNRELCIILKSLEQKIDDGFKGVHDRQDHTNGNVIDNTRRVSTLENWRWYIIGGGSVIMLVLTIGIKFIK